MLKKSNLTIAITILILIESVLNASTVYAYLDPGTGSAILQGILGGIAAIAIVLKLYWHRFLRLLGIRKGDQTANKESAENTK